MEEVMEGLEDAENPNEECKPKRTRGGGESRISVEEKISSGVYIIAKVKKKSSCWNYFSMVLDAATEKECGFVRCDKCKAIFKYKSHRSGTSTFTNHAKRCTGVRNFLVKKKKPVKKGPDEPYVKRNISDEEREEAQCKIQDGTYTVKKCPRKSEIWQSFSFILDEDDTVIYTRCEQCHHLYRFEDNTTGTSKLKNHLTLCSGDTSNPTRRSGRAKRYRNESDFDSDENEIENSYEPELPIVIESNVNENKIIIADSNKNVRQQKPREVSFLNLKRKRESLGADERTEVEKRISYGDYSLTVPKKSKSPVWRFFSMVVSSADGDPCGYARCKKCATIYRYQLNVSGYTTFLRHAEKCSGYIPPQNENFDIKNVSDADLAERDEKLLVLKKVRRGEYQKVSILGKSKVWKYFFQLRDFNYEIISFVMCKVCEKVFKFKQNNTGTTTLKRHTKMCKESFPEMYTAGSAASQKNGNTPVYNSAVSSVKNIVLNNYLSLCAEDILPYGNVERPGLLKYAQAIINVGASAGYIDMNRLSQLIPDKDALYKEMKTKAAEVFPQLVDYLNKMLTSAQNVAVTITRYFDTQSNHYIGINCHYISDWVMKSISLGCIKLLGKIEELDILSEIHKFLSTIGLHKNDLKTKLKFVTNRTSDRTGDVYPCFINVVNAIIHHTLADYKLEKCFDYGNQYYELRDEEFESDISALLTRSLYLENNFKNEYFAYEYEESDNLRSSFQAILSISNNQALIEENLDKNSDIKLDFEKINAISSFLKPFKVFVDTLSKQDTCSIYGILLFKMKLDNHIEVKYEDSPLLRKLKLRAQTVYKDKFKILPFHRIATLLCPKFKNLNFLSSAEKEETFASVQSYVRKLSGTKPYPVDNYGKVIHADKNTSLLSFDEFIEDRNVGTNSTEELQKYLQTNFVVERSDKHIGGVDVLNFWKENEAKYPCLAKLAKSVFCIPSFTQPGEYFFESHSSIVVNKDSNYTMESLNSILILDKCHNLGAGQKSPF